MERMGIMAKQQYVHRVNPLDDVSGSGKVYGEQYVHPFAFKRKSVECEYNDEFTFDRGSSNRVNKPESGADACKQHGVCFI